MSEKSDRYEYLKIKDAIKESDENGKCWLFIDTIPESVVQKLRDEGYKVENNKNISWKYKAKPTTNGGNQ